MAVGKEVYLTGLRETLANLNKEVLGIKNRSRAGMTEAATMIKARSMKLTPVDTNTLRLSAYYRTWMRASGPGAEIGYRASYAPFVHEIDKNYKHGKQWKFLETAMNELRGRILDVIRKSARIK